MTRYWKANDLIRSHHGFFGEDEDATRVFYGGPIGLDKKGPVDKKIGLL
jgi:hypothetical protein